MNKNTFNITLNTWATGIGKINFMKEWNITYKNYLPLTLFKQKLIYATKQNITLRTPILTVNKDFAKSNNTPKTDFGSGTPFQNRLIANITSSTHKWHPNTCPQVFTSGAL